MTPRKDARGWVRFNGRTEQGRLSRELAMRLEKERLAKQARRRSR